MKIPVQQGRLPASRDKQRGVDRFDYTADGLVQKRYANGILKLQYAYDKMAG